MQRQDQWHGGWLLGVCLALALVSATAEAATYYTATNGSDSSVGSQSSPFRTINRGVSVLTPGDTLLIRGGEYTEELNTNDGPLPAGTSWQNPVTIAAAPNETVTMYGRLVLNTPQTAYMIFRGLILDGKNFGGTAEVVFESNGAHHIRIEECHIRHAGGQGAQNGDAGPGLEYLRNKIYKNGRNRATDGSESHGMYLSAPSMLLEGNEVYDNPGYGIQLYHRGISRGDDSILRKNYIHNNTGSGGGVVIAMASRVQFYDNVLASNAHGGLDISYGAPIGTQVYHNTFTGNGGGYCVVVMHSAKGTVVRNNICDDAGGTFQDTIGDTSFTANLCRVNGPGCALVGDPKLVNAATHDVHLQAGSPAIGAGAMIQGLVGLLTDYYTARRPTSGAWDVGASMSGGGGGVPPTAGLPAPTAVSVTFAMSPVPGAVLTWAYPPGIPFDHFVAYAKPQPTGSWRTVGTTPPAVLTITDTAIAAEQTTCWVIRAVLADGTESGPSNTLCGTAPAEVNTPVGCTGYLDEQTRIISLQCAKK